MGAGFQPSLFGSAAPAFDATYARLVRIRLDAEAWVDYAPGWVGGSDVLFEQVLAACDWRQRERWMYDRRVREPRLTAWWERQSGRPLQPPLLELVRGSLRARYGVVFDSAGFNLYRDGGDSVAWHADHIERRVAEPLVPLVSLGEPRRFLLRPKGGGPSRAFLLGRGDLLVTGGRTQRTWEHAVPKAARAGPRISIAFRCDVDTRACLDAEPD